jgi:ionotropic glutamate receptor
MEAGLINYWDVWFRPMPLQCMGNLGDDSKTSKLKNKKPPALTLNNLTGAFVILLFGFSLSLLAFLCEKIVSMPSRNHRRLKLIRKTGNTF